MMFGLYYKWAGLCIANHFCWLVVINEILTYTVTSVIFLSIWSSNKCLCVETCLYLTSKFYCFVKHKYSDFSFHFTWHLVSSILVKINIKCLKKFEENFEGWRILVIQYNQCSNKNLLRQIQSIFAMVQRNSVVLLWQAGKYIYLVIYIYI